MEKEIIEEKNELVVQGFGSIEQASKTKKKTYTTLPLTDVKTLYNLDNKDCDFRINDCIGQAIRVKDVVIKEFEKELEEPIVDTNGEVIQDKEFKKVCILIDDQEKSYVTASKVFTIQMKRFIETFGVGVFENGLDIRIVSKKINGSNNKALGFELI